MERHRHLIAGARIEVSRPGRTSYRRPPCGFVEFFQSVDNSAAAALTSIDACRGSLHFVIRSIVRQMAPTVIARCDSTVNDAAAVCCVYAGFLRSKQP